MTTSRAPLRIARSLSVGLVCVSTATVAHLVGGGAADPASVLAVFAASAVIGYGVSGRRIAPTQFVGLLVLAQLALHLLAPTVASSHDVGMLALHAAATVVSAVALCRGEDLAWRVVRYLATRGQAVLRVALVPVLPTLAAARAAWVPFSEERHHLPSVRGPPGVSA